uniref:Uncharacterized protein n=1 Tax=Mycena chlorophos TaxID=658473 RepID=A0ABQ0LEH5_MYCCL|nr:predicted protein [Mycena chlorophos]
MREIRDIDSQRGWMSDERRGFESGFATDSLCISRGRVRVRVSGGKPEAAGSGKAGTGRREGSAAAIDYPGRRFEAGGRRDGRLGHGGEGGLDDDDDELRLGCSPYLYPSYSPLGSPASRRWLERHGLGSVAATVFMQCGADKRPMHASPGPAVRLLDDSSHWQTCVAGWTSGVVPAGLRGLHVRTETSPRSPQQKRPSFPSESPLNLPHLHAHLRPAHADVRASHRRPRPSPVCFAAFVALRHRGLRLAKLREFSSFSSTSSSTPAHAHTCPRISSIAASPPSPSTAPSTRLFSRIAELGNPSRDGRRSDEEELGLLSLDLVPEDPKTLKRQIQSPRPDFGFLKDDT